MSFNGRFVANIIRFAATQGASRKDLLALTNMEFEVLSDMETKVSSEVYNAVLEKAVEQTRNQHLGLHLGNFLSLSAAGIIVQIVQLSRTVEEGLNYIIQFANLGCSSLPFQLNVKNDKAIISVKPIEAWMQQSALAVEQTIDGYFVFTLRECFTLTRKKFRPEYIHLRRKKPKSFMEFEKIFECPVYFSKNEDAIFFDSKLLKEEVVTSDYELLKVLVQHAEAKLEKVNADKGIVEIVKQSIISLIKPQFPSLEQVADNLNVSTRTLQRRLRQENQTFKSVLEELKRQWAIDYLKKPELSVKEIAYLLDYSEPSAFVRSFKRWTGKSPGEFRN